MESWTLVFPVINQAFYNLMAKVHLWKAAILRMQRRCHFVLSFHQAMRLGIRQYY
jgi:hypothetical protein